MSTVLFDKDLVYKRGVFIIVTLVTVLLWYASYVDAKCSYYFYLPEVIWLFPGLSFECSRLTLAITDVALSGLLAIMLVTAEKQIYDSHNKWTSALIFCFFVVIPALTIYVASSLDQGARLLGVYMFYVIATVVFSGVVIFFYDHTLLKYHVLLLASLTMISSLSQGLLAGMFSLIIGLVTALVIMILLAVLRLAVVRWARSPV